MSEGVSLACQHCGRDCSSSSDSDSGAAPAASAAAAAAVKCPGCGGLAFCSAAHLHAFCAAGLHSTDDCARMAQQMARRGELLPQPAFAPWCEKTPAQLCRLLKALGVHDAPAWRCACPLHAAATAGALEALLAEQQGPPVAPNDASAAAASRAAWEAAWRLDAAAGAVPRWEHRSCSATGGAGGASSSARPIIDGWRAYYAAAGLSAASPAALLLDRPLTLWLCLERALAAARGRAHGRQRERQQPLHEEAAAPVVVVHYLGPREELLALPLFIEVALLLPPGTELVIAMIGPDVPRRLHGTEQRWRALPGGGALAVTTWRGRYDEVVDEWAAAVAAAAGCDGGGSGGGASIVAARAHAAAPDLVFAPNAGLPAFASWEPTLRRLLEGAHGDNDSGAEAVAAAGAAAAPPPAAAPFAASDYCEEAAFQSLRLLDALAPGRCRVRGELNPFRRLVADAGSGTALPACGNALLFGWGF